MKNIYDIVIVGSGPAGATLSMLLQNRGMKIAQIDKRPFDEAYDIDNPNLKSCGGLLSTDAQESISRLNLNIPNDVLENPQILNVRNFDFDNNLVEDYQRNYLNMNREKFDRFLADQTTSDNVEKMYSTTVMKIEYQDDTYTLKCRDKSGNTHLISSKILVGSDGAMSKVRNTFFYDKNIKSERYASLQKVYKNSNITPQFISIFGSEITDYYGWGFTKGDLFYLGFGSNPGENAAERFEIMKRKLEEHGYEFGDEYRSEGTVLIRPAKVGKIVSNNGSVYLIGEAANFISPSSAEGISFGLNSAMALAESLAASDDLTVVGKTFVKKTKYLRSKVVKRNLKSKVLSSKVLRGLIMKSKITTISKIK